MSTDIPSGKTTTTRPAHDETMIFTGEELASSMVRLYAEIWKMKNTSGARPVTIAEVMRDLEEALFDYFRGRREFTSWDQTGLLDPALMQGELIVSEVEADLTHVPAMRSAIGLRGSGVWPA